MAGFAIYLLILYFDGMKLSAGSRAFPIVIMGVSVALMILKLVTFKLPALRFLDTADEGKEKKEDGAERDVSYSKTVQVILFLVWLATFPVGMHLLGFMPTMFIWQLVFLIALSKIKVSKSVLISICTFVAIFIVFDVLLGINFRLGICSNNMARMMREEWSTLGLTITEKYWLGRQEESCRPGRNSKCQC